MNFPKPNVAPDLVTLFDVETHTEPHLKAILEERIIVPGSNLSIVKTRDTAALTTPRIDAHLQLGGAYPGGAPRRYLYDGGSYYNAWDMTLILDVVTVRLSNNVPDAIHASLRAQLRLAMQYGSAALPTEALPHHEIVQVIDAGTQYIVREKEDTDVSRLSFKGVIAIREDSWPALPG